jgi:hypothetical protein
MKLKKYPLISFQDHIEPGMIITIPVPRGSEALQPQLAPDGIFMWYEVPSIELIGEDGENQVDKFIILKDGAEIPARTKLLGLVDVISQTKNGEQAIVVIPIYKYY